MGVAPTSEGGRRGQSTMEVFGSTSIKKAPFQPRFEEGWGLNPVRIMGLKLFRSGEQPESTRNKIQPKQQEVGHPKDKESETGVAGEGREEDASCTVALLWVGAEPWANGKQTNVACGNSSYPSSFTSTHSLE